MVSMVALAPALLAGAAVVAAVGAAGGHARPSGQPNFLIIHADDLGYGDLGCYGHPTSVTPNIDKLASDGARFTQFYSASPVCSPSRAGLLTGRWPARVGVYCANDTIACDKPEDSGLDGPCCNGVWLPGMPGGVPTETPTIASRLKQLDYRTAAIGKWHLGGLGSSPSSPSHHPSKYGFDEYFGCPHGLGACPVSSCFCPDEGCAIAGSPNWTGCPLYANSSIVAQPADLLTLSAQYVAAAVDFVGRAARAGDRFLQYYASHHVHSPQFAGRDATNTTRRGRFGASLAELDHAVGKLLQALADNGVDADTLVLMTSDNGPSLRNQVRGGNAGLLRCGKGTTFEGGLRVPMIARWPGKIAPGAIRRAVMASIDLLPTVLQLAALGAPPHPAAATAAGMSQGTVDAGAGAAGVKTGPRINMDFRDVDGVAAVELLLGTGGSPRNDTYVYFPQFPQRSRGVYGGIYAARAGRWKVHWCLQGSLQCGADNPDTVCGPSQPYTVLHTPLLFDIELDASEQYPLAATDPDYPTGLAAATAAAERHAKTMQWYPEAMLNSGPFDKHGQPCCNPGCTPWPTCCNCNKLDPQPRACAAGLDTTAKTPWQLVVK